MSGIFDRLKFYFNPQNTTCMSAVNPPKFGGGLKLSLFLKLNKNCEFKKYVVIKCLGFGRMNLRN
jgi:hypothetical protein